MGHRGISFRRPIPSQDVSKVVNELAGYMDLGMHTKAIPLALKILKSKRVLMEEFEHAVEVLVSAHPNLRKCGPTIQSAYSRFSIRNRKKVRSSMLSFYHHVGDHAKALLFIARQPTTPEDYTCSLGTYLKLDLMEDAERLALQGKRRLKLCTNLVQQGYILGTLAHYYTRRGHHSQAIRLWECMPGDIALGFDKFESITKLHAARSLASIQESLAALHDLQSEGDLQFDMAYPGLFKKLIQHARRQLTNYSKSLELILPRSQWQKYGLK